MKVLMVLNRYYPMIGGAEKQARILINELIRLGVDVESVITNRYDNSLSSSEMIDGTNILRFGSSSSMFSFYVSLFLFIIFKSKANIIHVHSISVTTFVAYIAALFSGKKVIAKLTVEGELSHILSSHGIKSYLKRKIVGFTVRNVSIVALTTAGKNEVMSFYPEKGGDVIIIENGVDCNVFCNSRLSTFSADQETITFGFVGRFTQTKGILELYNFFCNEIELKTGNKVKFIVLGSGAHQVDSVESLLVGNEVVEIKKPYHQPADFYNQIDFYVSNSKYEGMPNTVLEALASGRYCFLSDIPAHRELEKLFPTLIQVFSSFTELNRHIEHYILNSVRPPESDFNFFRTKFDISKTSERYVHFYNKVINN